MATWNRIGGIRVCEGGSNARFGQRVQIGPAFKIRVGGQRKAMAVSRCEVCGENSVAWMDALRKSAGGCGRCESVRVGREVSKIGSQCNTKHGMSRSKEFQAWCNMRARCTNESNKHYDNYGGRGISVCDRWSDSFSNFLADVGIAPSASHAIDRIDNNKGYEPGNVQWVTRLENQRNRRVTRMATVYGKTLPVTKWSDISGVGGNVIASRLDLGWDHKRAVFQAVEKRRRA